MESGEDGKAVVTSVTGGAKLFYGTMDKSFRRKLSKDDHLHFWNSLKQHHGFAEKNVEKAKAMALRGGKECDWGNLAARIAMRDCDKYGAGHPHGFKICGPKCCKRLHRSCSRASAGIA